MPVGATRSWGIAYAPNGYMIRPEHIIHPRDVHGLPPDDPYFFQYPRGVVIFNIFDDKKQPWNGERSRVKGLHSYPQAILVRGDNGVQLIVAVRNLCVVGPIDERWAEFEIGLVPQEEKQ